MYHDYFATSTATGYYDAEIVNFSCWIFQIGDHRKLHSSSE